MKSAPKVNRTFVTTFQHLCVDDKFKLAIGDKEVLVKRSTIRMSGVNAYGVSGGAYQVPLDHKVFIEV